MEHVRGAFAELVGPGNGEISGELDLGAILIAASVDPDVDVQHQLKRLDDLASGCTSTTVPELTQELFGGVWPDPAVHFRGNHKDYYEAKNSLLPCVLDRRLGIPITLSVLAIEVGRRLSVELHGVGMPGHFLVGTGDAFFDVFDGGSLLDSAGCEKLFQRLAGPHERLPPGALAPTAPATILKRILHNLSAIASNRGDRRMLLAVRSFLAVYPEATHREHVQHAYAASNLAQYGQAARAAELALATLPEDVRPRLEAQIDSWRAQLN